jgi:esterase/lipase superfamily enzyme
MERQGSSVAVDIASAERFIRFAQVLFKIVSLFAETPRRAYSRTLERARGDLLGAFDYSSAGRAHEENFGQLVSPLIADTFDRPSLKTSEPTEDAVRSLFIDLFAALRLVLDDPAIFKADISAPERRRVRSALAPLFSTAVFQPVGAQRRRGRTVPLSAVSIRLQKRLSVATQRLSGAEGQFSMIARDEPRSKVRMAPRADWIGLEAGMDLGAGDGEDGISSRSAGASVPPVELTGVGDRIHRIWYGTNRAPIKPTDEAFGYGSEVDLNLHYGYCHVFVPRTHQIGSVNTSWGRRIWTLSNSDSLELRERFPLERERFQKKMDEDLAQWGHKRTGLMYLHGFNVKFDEAALLAAQIGCDLEVNGIIGFYSWPAAGGVLSYGRDRETTQLPVISAKFVEFIDTFLSISNLDRLDIVAHSMGNRVVAGAIDEIRQLGASRQVAIGHLVLAAPDISRVEFKDIAPIYGQTASSRVTLYTSKHDKALWGSNKVNGYTRVGFEPPVFCHAALDTVSVSQLRLGILGHGYVAAAKPVLEDMKLLLWKNEPPSGRNLEQVPTTGIPDYWRIKKV